MKDLQKGASFMTTTELHLPGIPFPWQDEKRLRSGDRAWILTDIQSFWSAIQGRSTPQQFFRVGGLDLETKRLGYFLFTIDDARALLKARLPPPPWTEPLPVGIELTRHYHGNTEQGRFRESVSLIRLDHDLVAQKEQLRTYFEDHLYFHGNSSVGMWAELQRRARELRAIEDAALQRTGWFSASDVKYVLKKDLNVTPVLQALVAEEKLVWNGKKTRGARYMVTDAAAIARVVWCFR
jgi:hypothetical protein